jgi:hypothetical protein
MLYKMQDGMIVTNKPDSRNQAVTTTTTQPITSTTPKATNAGLAATKQQEPPQTAPSAANQTNEKQVPGPNQITKGTKERAEHAKAFIESKYSKLKNDEKERKEAWDMLENKMVRLNLSE